MKKLTLENLFNCLSDLKSNTIVTVEGVGEKFTCKYKDISPAIRDWEVENAHFSRDVNGEIWEDYFTVKLKVPK